MTNYDIVEKKLEQFTDFRERSNRSKYLAVLAMRNIGIEHKIKNQFALTLKEMADFGIAFDTFRRVWVQVLKDRKDLRGSDYDDKGRLVQEKLLEMSYEPQRKLKI